MSFTDVMAAIARRVASEPWFKDRHPSGRALVVFRNGKAVAVESDLQQALSRAKEICADEDRGTVVTTDGQVVRDLRCARTPGGSRVRRFAGA